MEHVLNGDALGPFIDRLRRRQLAVLVALGDSNTCNASFTAGHKQWPELVHTELRGRYQTQRILLVNAGICGDTVVGALARLDSDVLAFGPSLTVVSFGSNDATRIPADQFRERLNELVDRLESAGSVVALRTSPPVMELEPAPPHIWRDDDEHWRLMDINREVAVARGLPLVDIHGMWIELEERGQLQIGDLMHDCVHPNEHGHRLMARQMAPLFGMPPTFHWERGGSAGAEETDVDQ